MAISVALVPDKTTVYAKGDPITLTFKISGADPVPATFTGTIQIDGVDRPASVTVTVGPAIGPATVPGFTVDPVNPLAFHGTV